MTSAKTAASVYSVLFFVAAVLAIVMLLTDKNLQTDFGSKPSGSMFFGYFLHWWAVALAAVATLVGGVLLLAVRSRRAIAGGVVGSALLSLVFLGDIAAYSASGFASAGDFAKYLFGITYGGGDIRYLYDALLSVYLFTFFLGLGLYRVTRPLPGETPRTP